MDDTPTITVRHRALEVVNANDCTEVDDNEPDHHPREREQRGAGEPSGI